MLLIGTLMVAWGEFAQRPAVIIERPGVSRTRLIRAALFFFSTLPPRPMHSGADETLNPKS